MIKHIDVEELERVEDAVFIDVREPEEFKKGSLPFADNIPLSDFLEKAEAGKLGYPKKDMLIINCRTGSRSLVATEAAKKAGYRKAHNLRGGYVKYEKFMRTQ